MAVPVEAFKEAVSKVCSSLGVSNLYKEQKNALFNFLSKKDVLFNLPTSYGKSLIFEIAPLVAGELASSCPQFVADSIIIVISPLVALMRGQVASLEKKNIPAAYVAAEQDAAILKDVGLSA
ncbi:ATP-dependent DNA helicase RecQ-like, partial [Oculina patagonica]